MKRKRREGRGEGKEGKGCKGIRDKEREGKMERFRKGKEGMQRGKQEKRRRGKLR